MIMVGGGALEAGREVLELAELLQAPVVSFRSGRGVVASDHHLGFSCAEGFERWAQTDVLIGIGSRLELQWFRWPDQPAIWRSSTSTSTPSSRRASGRRSRSIGDAAPTTRRADRCAARACRTGVPRAAGEFEALKAAKRAGDRGDVAPHAALPARDPRGAAARRVLRRGALPGGVRLLLRASRCTSRGRSSPAARRARSVSASRPRSGSRPPTRTARSSRSPATAASSSACRSSPPPPSTGSTSSPSCSTTARYGNVLRDQTRLYERPRARRGAAQPRLRRARRELRRPRRARAHAGAAGAARSSRRSSAPSRR